MAENQKREHTPTEPASDVPRDDELIERAKAASNGAKFQRLWAGDAQGYASESEADLALCSILAGQCGANAERIDRLFRRSVLYRAKWERSDYRKPTIDKAIGQSFHDDRSAADEPWS